MNKAWLLVAALLVVTATSNGLEKRQSFNLGTRPGPNNEVILTCNGEDVVFLTGNNAQSFDVGPGHIVDNVFGVVSITDENGVEVQNIPGISDYQAKLCNPLIADAVGGPGTLYVSDVGRAFYINDGCTFENSFINQAIDNAPSPTVVFEVMTSLDVGSLVSNLIVNSGEFQITISGAMAMALGPADSLSYSGGSISTLQGVMISGGIMEFAVFDRGVNGQAEFNIFDPTESTVVTGPGQVFIGADKAIFIGNLGSGTTPPFESINRDIVMNTFDFITNTAGMTLVMSQTDSITVLSPETATFEINGLSTSTFSGMMLTFTTTGGQVSNFNGITQFAVFDNNEVTINPSFSSYATGGTVFIDPIEETAFFTTDSNPVAQQIFTSFIPPEERVTYSIETDSEGVRNLLRMTGSPPQTDFICLTTTGSYVTNVDSSETVVYSGNEVQIQTFFGSPRVRIGQVDRLFTNTASNPAGNFTTSAATPFVGPGTVSYSRGTGFYTTDSNLGNDISFQSRTAPIPDVDFERTPITTNEVDGVNYTVSMITQTIGGERVITYEATSYTTTSEQEILYADNLATVHRPIFTGDGSVTYDGATQEVTYPDRDGNEITLMGVTSFNQFSGGDVTTTTSPENTQAQGPGKLYVSDDGAIVTFSTSNIITPEVTALIRGTPVDFMVNADQFSSIYDGTFNISTETATVTYPGGGVIWSSQFDNTDYALYVDDERESNRIEDAVSSLLLTTKSEPAKDSGILRVIFNGREIYSYSPVGGNREVRIPPSGFFNYVDMTLSGPSLPGGPYTGYNSITVFDCEVRQFNSSTTVQRFEGPGFLLLPQDSNRAFYTTNPSTTNYLVQSIAILRGFLDSPRIQPGKGRKTTKNRDRTVDFGTDVTVFEGADVTFKCNVIGGRPEPTVGFYRVISDTEQVLLNSTDGEIIIENNALTLLNVQMDDVGDYVCVASNGVPPPAMATSTLESVRPAVAPVLQPGWFPFRPTSGQKLIFPDTPPVTETINLREFTQLVLACRMDGRPKVEITWQINDQPLVDVLIRGGQVLEPVQGRSVLILDLLNTFNETFDNPLLGRSTIDCIGGNLAGSANGRVNLQGEITECGTMAGGPCSVTCGFGTRDVAFDCTRYNPNPAPIDISEVPLSIIPLIDRTEICTTSDVNNNVIVCPVIEYRWNTTEWSECSKTCNGGVRTRNASCLEEEFPINSRYVALVNSTILRPAEDTMCAMSEKAGPRPSERELCETQDCPFYQVSPFGECSATCGGGVRTRTVECVILLNKYKDMNGKTQLNVTDVNITQCGGEPPEESEMCNTFDCFYRWIPGRFGECGDTPSLDPPVSNEFSCKERPVTCVNDMQVPVNDSFCEAAEIPKPPILASCGNKNCFVGIWDTARFSPCSRTCGYGTQERERICRSPQTMTPVPTDFCDITKAPITERQCFVRNCENMCLRDETPGVCAILARLDMCGSQLAMGSSGLRCCVSCGMGTGSD